jgi:hypothetical protein
MLVYIVFVLLQTKPFPFNTPVELFFGVIRFLKKAFERKDPK